MPVKCALCQKVIDKFATCAKCQRRLCFSHLVDSPIMGGRVCPACVPKCYFCGDKAEVRCSTCKKFVCRSHLAKGSRVKVCKQCGRM